METAVRHFDRAAKNHGRQHRNFNRAYDKFIASVWYQNEAIAIQPQNVEKSKRAFNDLCDEMGWHLAKWSFEELLHEKSGKNAFRADGRTPNWYHEFRENLMLLAFVRAGHIKQDALDEHGGVDVALATGFRHDSWEDFGRDKDQIFQSLEKRINYIKDTGSIDASQAEKLFVNAYRVASNVELLTRKIPVLGPQGEFQFLENGKMVKEDRFGGQDNLYYSGVISAPITTFSKYCDGIEGMSTRIGVINWTRDDDIKYTNERRKLYGRRALDVEAQDKFPFLKRAVRAADAMLGILLVCMETVNDYAPDSKQHPRFATRIRIDDYLPAATRGFKYLPPAFHPMHVFLERMESKAEREVGTELEGRTRLLIDKALIPSIGNAFDHLRYPRALPRRPVSVFNVA